MLQLLVIAAILGIASPAQAESPRTHLSPAGGLHAVVSSVGPTGSESRIEIRASNRRLLRYLDLRSSDGEHGFFVSRAAWTSDGLFFVFSATSSGGHQPWHLPTYVYSRRHNRLYSLDAHVGPVTSAFELISNGRVAVTRLGAGPDPHDERVVFQLSRLGRRFNAPRPN
jgi:hypothetical protein